MTYEGKIIKIYDTELVGKNQMEKRTFVLEEVSEKEYKSSIAIDLIKERTKAIDKFVVGDVVTAHLNFRATEGNGRHFNSVNCWRIEGDSSATKVEEEEILPF